MSTTEENTRLSPARKGIAWLSISVAIIVAFALTLLPAPYVIEEPGSTYNTLGFVNDPDSGEIPMIQIPSVVTYPTDGSLDLVTVRLRGTPQNRVNWLTVFFSLMDPAKELVDMSLVYPEGQDLEEVNAANQLAMENSQREAVAAALRYLDYEVPGVFNVYRVLETSPNVDTLLAGDTLLSVAGELINSVDHFKELIAQHVVEGQVEVRIERDGTGQNVLLGTYQQNDQLLIGIEVLSSYNFPLNVQIRLDQVGGPSAGLMFTLGIIDKLRPESLTNGQHIAGTGTISADGTVGAIGGAPQKLHAARAAGAVYFLIPTKNCEDIIDRIPNGLTVFPVDTLTQAVATLDALASGSNPDHFKKCS